MKIFVKSISFFVASIMMVVLNFGVCANGVSKERIVQLLKNVKIENGPETHSLFKYSYTDSIIDGVAKILADMQVTEDELVAENGVSLFESFKRELQQNGCIWDVDKLGESIKILINTIQRSNFSSNYKLINHYEVGEAGVIATIQHGEDIPERKYYSFFSNDDMKQHLSSENCYSSRNCNLSKFNSAIAKFCWGISIDELVDNKNYVNELIELLKFSSEFVYGNIDDLPYKYSDMDLTPNQYKVLNQALVDRFMENYNFIEKSRYQILYDDATGYIKSIEKGWVGFMCNGCFCI